MKIIFPKIKEYLPQGIFVLIISAILLPFAVLEEGSWFSGLSGESIERAHWSLILIYNSLEKVFQAEKGDFFFVGIYILISTMSALALLLLSLQNKLSLSPQQIGFRNCIHSSLSFLMSFLIMPVGFLRIRYFHIGSYLVTCGWLLAYIYSIIQVIYAVRKSLRERKSARVKKIPKNPWLITGSILTGMYVLFFLFFVFMFCYSYFHELGILNVYIIILLSLAFFSPLVITGFFVKEMYFIKKTRAIIWIIGKDVLLAVFIFFLLFFFRNASAIFPSQAYFQFIFDLLTIAVLLSCLAFL